MASRRWLSIDRRVMDPIFSLLETDRIDVQKYFSQWGNSGALEPEKALMFAVLREAVECFQENALCRTRWEEVQFKDAERWIFQDDHAWLFSFINICDAFAMNPGYLRQGLLGWKEKAIRSRPRPAVGIGERKAG